MFNASRQSKPWYTKQAQVTTQPVSLRITCTNDLWAADLKEVGFYTARAELDVIWQQMVYRTICDCVKYAERFYNDARLRDRRGQRRAKVTGAPANGDRAPALA